jgi:hypothetical protein
MADGIKSLNYPNPQDQLAARLLDLEDRIAQAEKIISGQNLGLRNFIINGDMRINQRGFSTRTNGGYTFDRWTHGWFGGSVTATRQTFASGGVPLAGNASENFLRVAVSGQSANDHWAQIWQPIEDVRTLAGRLISVSFWAKSDAPRDIEIELAQGFGTGGSPVVFANAGRVRLSTSWQRHSVTAFVPSVAGKTIGPGSIFALVFWLSAGTAFVGRSTLGIQSGSFDLWGVQVEEGSKPTAFEVRPMALELALCQRYFCRYTKPSARGVFAGANSVNRLAWAFPVEMRATPTVTATGTFGWWNGITGLISAISSLANYSTTLFAEIDGAITGGTYTAGQVCILYQDGGSGYIDVEAEL